MRAQVEYLNRLWDVMPRGAGFLLTYAEPPPEHLAGRVLYVDVDGCVYECTRDGLGTVGPKIDNPPDPLRDERWALERMEQRGAIALELAKQRAAVAHLETQPTPKNLHQRIAEG